MHYSKHLATATLTFFIAFAALPASAELITTDMTIDGSSPFDGVGITVSDGNDGPTTVRVVQGGGVAGFELQESSHLILDGGDVTLLGSLTDNSTFTILSGQLGCSEPVCQLMDISYLISASGNSVIELKGGFSGGAFSLRDDSTMKVYGTNLAMLDQDSDDEFTVQGTLLDGSEFQTVVHAKPGQIILIEVPEPTAVILLLSSLPLLLLLRQNKRRNGA